MNDLKKIEKKVLELVEKMEREAFYEGWEYGLFSHTDTFHTVKTRQKMLNHKALKEQMLSEIKNALKDEP